MASLTRKSLHEGNARSSLALSMSMISDSSSSSSSDSSPVEDTTPPVTPTQPRQNSQYTRTLETIPEDEELSSPESWESFSSSDINNDDWDDFSQQYETFRATFPDSSSDEDAGSSPDGEFNPDEYSKEMSEGDPTYSPPDYDDCDDADEDEQQTQARGYPRFLKGDNRELLKYALGNRMLQAQEQQRKQKCQDFMHVTAANRERFYQNADVSTSAGLTAEDVLRLQGLGITGS